MEAKSLLKHMRISAAPRARLVALAVLAVLPMALLLAYWVTISANAQQRRTELELQQSADALAHLLENQLAASVGSLHVLAAMGPVQRHQIAALERILRDEERHQGWPDWRSAYLRDRNGKLLFDTSNTDLRRQPGVQPADPTPVFPAGPAVSVAPDAPSAAPAGARISSVVAGDSPAQSAVAIEVPVWIAGTVRYRLGAWIPAAFWQRILRRHSLPPGAIARLYDREQRLIGQSGAPSQTTPMSIRQTVALAGWSVEVGLPAAAVAARQEPAVVTLLTGGMASLALGIALALLTARRLDQAGDSVINGEPRTIERMVLREVAQFETLFENSPIGLAFAQDADCREVLQNTAMTALFGPPGSNETVQVLHRGRPLERHNQPLQRAAAHGEPVRGMELELVTPDQDPRFVLVSAVPLSNGEGRPRGALSAVVDITGRKRAEARLVSAERHLRESQRLIDLAQEAGRVGFFHYLFEPDTLVWTPGLSRLLGMNARPRESTLAQFLSHIADDHKQRVEEAFRQASAAHQDQQTLEFRVALPNGEWRWLSSRIMMNFGDDGQPQEIIGFTLDIDDHKEAERSRAVLIQREHAARVEAEAANRAKDEFLAMLGHELRNPLSAISAAVEVLNHTEATADIAVNARKVIARQTRHLAYLMDDLLDVARVISGKILLTRQRINLAPLVERLLATMKLTGLTSRHQITTDLHEVWADADPTRIEQVINNLLTNAIKYTMPGGHIEVRVVAEGDHALLAVRDTGVGIPPALLPKIFDLFVQAERTQDRRAGGLGIGLTLVRRLVELHGGSITAASTPSGSVFSVRLPAIAAPLNVPQREPLASPPHCTIGIIEDNKDVLGALHEILELEGHSVWSATDGISGLASLLERRPEVAVIDIGLPGLTGLEVARRSRAAGYAGRMIALSGYGQEDDAQHALAAGFDAYMVKPVDPRKLLRILAED